MEKEKYFYKLCDEEENSYYAYISTDIKCDRLIGALVDLYKNRYSLPSKDDEDYIEDTERYLLDIKKGLNSIKKLFADSNDFDHKAEEIVEDMCEDFDCYGGNAEEYVYDTLKELGIDVHYEDIKTFYY